MNPPKQYRKPPSAEDLREQAEERVRGQRESIDELSDRDARALAHELSVHQVELEIQNESLREAEADLRDLYRRYRNVYENAPVGYLSLDASRIIRAANLTAASLLGRERDALLGEHLESLVAPEWVDDCYLHCKRVLSSHRPQVLQAEFLRVDDTRFWGRLEIVPLDEPEEEVVCHAVLSDSSHRQEAEQLRESEKRIRALVTASEDVLYRMSPDWEEMRELLSQDFLAETKDPDRKWMEKYIHPDDRPRVLAAIREAVRTRSAFKLQHRVVREDGGIGWISSRAIPILDEQGNIVEWFGSARDITDRKELEDLRQESHDQLEARVRERTTELRAMTKRLLAAQEDERRRIAAGLHDEVGQLLAACQIKLAGLGDLLPDDRKTETAEIEDLLATAADLIRDLIFELASPTLERAGFAAAARELCQNLQEREGLSIVWEEQARNHAVPTQVAACLYQSLRELLYNVARHAESEKARVTFECNEDSLRLVVHDDGKGFEPESVSKGLSRNGGFGLQNIRERVDALGGEVKIESIPGDGTRVEIRLPLVRPEAEPKGDRA